MGTMVTYKVESLGADIYQEILKQEPYNLASKT